MTDLVVASKKLGYPSLDAVAVNECIGVGLKSFAAVKRLFAGAAECALATHPRMLNPLKPDVARIVAEASGDGVRAVGMLRTVHAAPCQETGEICDTDAEYLLGKNMIDALSDVRNFNC